MDPMDLLERTCELLDVFIRGYAPSEGPAPAVYDIEVARRQIAHRALAEAICRRWCAPLPAAPTSACRSRPRTGPEPAPQFA